MSDQTPSGTAQTPYTVTIELRDAGSKEDAESLAQFLRHRPEIATAKSNIGKCEFGFGLHDWPKVFVAMAPIAVYAGKKGVDFLVQYLKDNLCRTDEESPPKIVLYGPDSTVVAQFTLPRRTWYTKYRAKRWRWVWWNRFWWFWHSLRR